MKKIIILLLIIPFCAKAQVERIKVLSMSRPQSGYIEVFTQMRLQLPSVIATNAQANRIFKTYLNQYNVLKLDTIATVVYAVIRPAPISISVNPAPTLAQIRTQILARFTSMQSAINSFTFNPYDAIIWQYYDGTSWGNSIVNDSL